MHMSASCLYLYLCIWAFVQLAREDDILFCGFGQSTCAGVREITAQKMKNYLEFVVFFFFFSMCKSMCVPSRFWREEVINVLAVAYERTFQLLEIGKIIRFFRMEDSSDYFTRGNMCTYAFLSLRKGKKIARKNAITSLAI